MAMLQFNPPSGSQIFHEFDPETESVFQAWYQQAAEAADLFGDWLKPLGLDPRIVRPRWAGCWFTLFCGLSSAGYPFPVSVRRKLEICDFIVVARDPNPLIFQPVDDVEGKPGKCFASSELIFVDDLLKATELAIHCIIEAAETRKPIHWCAGPSHLVCGSCGFERNADPYCPPTRCLRCGKEYANEERGDPIPPGYGLQCNDTVFVWDDTYVGITTTIAPVLKVLERAYRQGRDATTDEFESVLGAEIKNGFGSLFRMGKYPNKTIHPVRSAIWPPHGMGRKKYRLIDPVKVK